MIGIIYKHDSLLSTILDMKCTTVARGKGCHSPFALVTCFHTKCAALLSDGNWRVGLHLNSENTGKDTRPGYQVGSVGNAADLQLGKGAVRISAEA